MVVQNMLFHLHNFVEQQTLLLQVYLFYSFLNARTHGGVGRGHTERLVPVVDREGIRIGTRGPVHLKVAGGGSRTTCGSGGQQVWTSNGSEKPDGHEWLVRVHAPGEHPDRLHSMRASDPRCF